jgi:DNA invertase Pin-like site-specific DNA recombinase
MKIKYNRVSSLSQSGNRFLEDRGTYDITMLDKCSGKVKFAERENGKKLVELVEAGKVKELVVSELSRLGRNTGDTISTLEFLDKHDVNVKVQDIGLESMPSGKKNPIFKMISSIMSSLYENELDNIRERTRAGREVYKLQGGTFGRPIGSNESDREFMNKAQVKKIILQLEKGQSVRNTAKIVEVSPSLVQKTKRILDKQKVSSVKKGALKGALQS